MATQQEVLDDLIQAITNTNTSNDDFLKVLKEGRDQDVALRDGTVVPSLTKRVVNAFSNSDYLMKADKATESEAISGTDNTKFVTPLSLGAAIKALTINSALTQRNVTTQRFLNTNYTNSNESMKIVLVGFKLPQNANVNIIVGGELQGFVTNLTAQQTDNYLSLVGFIKPNETYRFNVVTGNPTVQFCTEMSL